MWPPPQFFELHSGLPREGPGDDSITRRAVGLLPELPPDPVVIDAGCGPGGQTLVLASALGVKVTAIDIHQPFVEVLKRRAEDAGLDHLIEARQGDMSALPFDPGTVHLIWCEGAIYQIGFCEGLELWRPLLADGGVVAASEAVWTADDPPAEVLPTFGVIPAFPPVFDALRKTGGNLVTLLHSAQRAELVRPFPPEGEMKTEAEVTGIWDMKIGALVEVSSTTKVAGETTARTTWQLLMRGEGGFGGPRPPKLLRTKPPAEADPAFRVEVPTTETQGRIHTSAVTVAVLPEAEEVDVQIETNDLKVDVYRSTGPGGQSVNTTDSAVRITHLPTGLVVTCQDEKSQLKNKNKAMKVLRARLLDRMVEEQTAQRSQQRKSQVGSGDRSGRIRTYNFPQGRVTDHRIGLTLYKLDEIMLGALDQVIDPLTAEHQADLLAAINEA